MNGTKTWVVNGSLADVYVVIAITEKDNRALAQDRMSIMLVDKNASGITIEKCNSVGLQGVDICNITFKDTPVPKGKSTLTH